MDWESIKRNFRFRSGRANRFEKRYPSHPPTRPYEPHNTPPSQSIAPSQPTASNGTRPMPPSSKTPSGASGMDAKPKREGPPTTKQTIRPLEARQPQTQGSAMEHANGAAAKPKKPKAKQPQGDTTTADSIAHVNSIDDTDDFDLRPQPRKKKATSIDVLSELLFSGGHLETILHDPELFARFAAFLNRYRPQVSPILTRYLETQKAIKAVEYANAVAQSVAPLPSDGGSRKDVAAAHIDSLFGEMRQNTFDQLLTDALPAYVTYSLIKVVTEIMVNEITGRSTPIMKGLVSGLSEVFCLTDPTQEDNPIIYASDEFYHMTGYSRDFVIGTNCRFLQGPKTKRHSVQRLREAIDSGQELSEALLNYRRDGRPFMNILMIAPLHDNKGNVKYHIGAQVDASGLIEGGKGLDGFGKYLANEQAKSKSRGRSSCKEPMTSQERLSHREAKKKALEILGELSEMFDLEENAIVDQRSRSTSRERNSEDEESIGSGRFRRIFAESTESESDEENLDETGRVEWNLSQRGRSGKLPGIYESYFLMRPSPSLKIIFASPALRKMGNLIQSRLLSHITAPPATLKGLKESFESGNPVTAKVLFSAQASESNDGRELDRGQGKKDFEETSSSKLGRTYWISATPLLGGDDEVGVWMVILIDQRSLGSGSSPLSGNRNPLQMPSRKANGDQLPDGSRKAPPSNSISASASKATRPSHIKMPDGIIRRQESSRQENSTNKSSVGQSSPPPRKSSEMPQLAKSGHNVRRRDDERLHRKQYPDLSSLPATPRLQEKSAEADEFVLKREPRDMSVRSNRVSIQPDTDDEDEDFTLANEPEAGSRVYQKTASEGQEKMPIQNGSVLGAEADTMPEKESNILSRAEPRKYSDRVEDGLASPEIGHYVPGKRAESTSNAESEIMPALVPEPLSERALEAHNNEMLVKEYPTAPVEEPHAQLTDEPNTSAANQVKEDFRADPDPAVLSETGPEDGNFRPATPKDDEEPVHDEDRDDSIIGFDQYDNIDGIFESSHSNSALAGSKAASGYMDYLRHPGSRPGSQRAMTATNLGSQGHAMGEFDQRQWDRHEDPDCDMRTPFSVD